MADITLTRPEAQQRVEIQREGARLSVQPGDAIMDRQGDDLIFTFEDGGVVAKIKELARYTASPTSVVEGAVVTGSDFFAALSEDLQPAAGPRRHRHLRGAVMTAVALHEQASVHPGDALLTSSATRTAWPERSTSEPCVFCVAGGALSHCRRGLAGAWANGCAVYTWDSGALSVRPRTASSQFFNRPAGKDVIFGGEKAGAACEELGDRHSPKAAFVYSTCTLSASSGTIWRRCADRPGPNAASVIPVKSEGFKGNKRAGYGPPAMRFSA